MSSLTGQTALVTGANSGIGKAVALALSKAGAQVAINYVAQPSAAEEMVQQIRRAGGRAIAVEANVSRESDVEKMFQSVIEAFGTVDILVSNAGIQRDAPFETMTLDQWNAVLGVNLTGAFLCARAAVREFLRRGLVRERSASAGKIVFTSSVHEVIPWAGHANYASSKGGLSMLMKTLAQELGPKKIRVNSVGPGAIETPINTKAWDSPEAAEKLRRLIPVGRIGQPEDIANVVVWLASDDSDYVHGTTLFVDGGMLLYPGFRTGG